MIFGIILLAGSDWIPGGINVASTVIGLAVQISVIRTPLQHRIAAFATDEQTRQPAMAMRLIDRITCPAVQTGLGRRGTALIETVGPPRMPPFRGPHGDVVPGSIESVLGRVIEREPAILNITESVICAATLNDGRKAS